MWEPLAGTCLYAYPTFVTAHGGDDPLLFHYMCFAGEQSGLILRRLVFNTEATERASWRE